MIADYSELVVEAASRSGHGDIVDRAKAIVGMAEAYLSRHLRVADMETSATLTTNANGTAALPSDYQDARLVRYGTATYQRVPYGEMQAGRIGFAVVGDNLHCSAKSANIALDYYASIPGLAANSTNWLLIADPVLYLQAVLFQVHTLKYEFDKAQAIASYRDSLLSDLQETDNIRRFRGTRIYANGVTP